MVIIALTEAGELQEAKMILDRMKMLQRNNPDGAWFECYDASNPKEISSCSNKFVTGPIAWMVIAVNYYESKTGDSRYALMANRALNWLDTLRNTNPEEEEIYGSLGYSNVDPDYISTEHNHDAYSAFYWRGILDSNNSYLEIAELILDYLCREMWAPTHDPNNANVFWRGFNDFEYCTDPQSWGALSLGAVGPHGEEFYKSLDWLYDNPYGSTRNLQDFNSSITDVDGFKSCTCESVDYIWVEGTAGVAAAFYSIGDPNKADYFHNQTQRVISSNAGLAHSFSETNPDSFRFPENYRFHHVASVAWCYFNERKINPFTEDSDVENFSPAKVTAKAGKSRTDPKDSLTISGELYVGVENFLDADSMTIRIYTINNQEEEIKEIISDVIVISDDQIEKIQKSRKFTYKRPKKGENSDTSVKSFMVNLKKHTFSLSAPQIDLTGLRLPFKIDIQIGYYHAQAIVNDQMKVNGPKKPMPMQFLLNYADALRVDQFKFKLGKKDYTDSLLVKGAIAVKDDSVYIPNLDVVVRWDDFEITIPANTFIKIGKKKAFKFKKSASSDPRIAAAVLDLEKASFLVYFKKADIGPQGEQVTFSISFGSFDQTVVVALPSASGLDLPVKGKQGKPLDQWINMRVSAANEDASNLVDIEIKYDLDRLWYFIMDDDSIDLDIYHYRERLHEICYFWVTMFAIDNNAYVDGQEGEYNQYIGGYYWGLFPNADGTPLNAQLTIPSQYGPGTYRIEVKTRLGTWDYSWYSPYRSSDKAEFVVMNFIW